MTESITCPYCNAPATLADSAKVYNGRSYGPVWLCTNYPKCDAYVGCHPGTSKPLGRLADKALRKYKSATHAYFDPIWRCAPQNYELPKGGQERKKAERRIRMRARVRTYSWLAEQLGIPVDQCHIGHFDIDTCERTIEILKRFNPQELSQQIRNWAKAKEGGI